MDSDAYLRLNNKQSKDAKNRKGGSSNANAGVRNDDNDVQIPSKLKDVIEDSDDDYPLHFSDPEQLLEIFSTLEEKNLFLIQ